MGWQKTVVHIKDLAQGEHLVRTLHSLLHDLSGSLLIGSLDEREGKTWAKLTLVELQQG